jgi:hypothetical protein
MGVSLKLLPNKERWTMFVLPFFAAHNLLALLVSDFLASFTC